MERSAACPSAQTRDLIQQLEAGSLQADEFFCMVLSLLGSHRTESQLPALVHSLRRINPTVYSELIDLHDTYFQKEVKSSDTLDYDMQLDLAISLSLQENPLPSQTPFDLNTNFQTQNLCSRISLADAAKPSAIQHTENHQKCAKAKPDLATVPVSVNEHKTTDQQRTFVDLSYGGQPEPEDCVLYTGGGDDLLYLESSGRKTNNAKKHRNRRRKRNTAPSKSPCSMRPALVWFRRDLRIHDNPALIAALELGVPIIPVFLWCSNEEAGQSFTLATGGATKYWLHHALWQLNQSLINKFGSHIIFRASESCCKELTSIVQETGAGTVLANAVYEPWLKERDDLISETLKKQGVTFNRCHSYCLYEPYSISTEGVGLRGIGSVTHFMSCCKRNCCTPIGDVLEAPTSLPIPSCWPSSMELEGLNLSRMPQRKDGTVLPTSNKDILLSGFVPSYLQEKSDLQASFSQLVQSSSCFSFLPNKLNFSSWVILLLKLLLFVGICYLSIWIYFFTLDFVFPASVSKKEDALLYIGQFIGLIFNLIGYVVLI